MALTRRLCTVILLAAGARAAPADAAAQVQDPVLEVIPERDSVTIGDSIPLRVRVRIDERDALHDSIPQLLGATPPGLRVLAAERVVRQPDRSFAGRMVVAFYRVGRQSIPPFGLTYRRNVNVLGATVRSEPATVEIVPVLPGGSSQQLRDIKDLVRVSKAWWVLPLIALGAGVILLAMRWSRRRRARRQAMPLPVVSGSPADGVERALERLRQIEREQWPAQGEVARHYDAVITVLRDYIAASTSIPARERTSAELVASLPATLMANGTREQLRGLLADADLVKFARARPAPPAPDRFLEATRALLLRWKTDAIR